ncbi:MAG: hypothetical protein HOV77_02030 [Hamadaea sp.]|uniref:DUF7660 family protein n=1 Tax=Hamadaea sp. TaxID=2024425 RepID=UPI0017F1DD58|nr:hypothetical protein [Hamadaea sp.]NUT17941.1 hypothetical protein [Hamadaea sp.]
MDAYSRFADVPEDQLQQVGSNADAAKIVALMEADLRAHPNAWENTDLATFLGALARCIDAQPQLYGNLGQSYPAIPSWKQFAEALVAATGYE